MTVIPMDIKEGMGVGTTFRINQFLAGTAGNGVFSFPQGGQNWYPINLGLTDLNITALAVDNNQQIFAATGEGGVFRFPAPAAASQTFQSKFSYRTLRTK